MFEVQDLRYATLTTVSRCGMIWFSEDVLWKLFSSYSEMFRSVMKIMKQFQVQNSNDDSSTFYRSNWKISFSTWRYFSHQSVGFYTSSTVEFVVFDGQSRNSKYSRISSITSGFSHVTTTDRTLYYPLVNLFSSLVIRWRL